jgi:hypothetical protein
MARAPRQIAVLVLILAALVPAVAQAAPGTVTLVRAAGDPGTPAEQWFLGWRMWRMHGATAWHPNSWARRSAYALDTVTAAAHPEWVLKDRYNRPLYVNGLPAADFGDGAYRAWWIGQATAQAAGLRGLYIDDVTMTRRASLSWGTTANPRDPRTGATMTEANWQRYMAAFMVAVRAAFPVAEIVHDVQWWRGDAGAEIARGLAAASFVAIEKGFNDPLTTGGAGTYGFQTLAAFVERRQAAGQGVILDAPVDSAAGMTFGLANLLLLDTGRLALGNDLWTAPGHFWPDYDVNIGAPTGARTSWSGVWRRDFAHGVALVNEPGMPSRALSLGPGYATLDLAPVTDLTLGAGTGLVLRKVQVPTPTPSPAPPPQAPETTVPTATATPAPRRPRRRSGSPTASIAGAAEPGQTSVTVTVGRLSVSGRVKGAVSGYVSVTVQRKRGKGWLTARRVKPNVGKRGRFEAAIARLPRGTYRVRARFEGTGTARPSRSPFRTHRL